MEYLEVIHTPGIQEEYCPEPISKSLFSGDTVFRREFGRMDFEVQNPKMVNSIEKLTNWM